MDKKKIIKISVIISISIVLLCTSFLAGRFIRQTKLDKQNIELIRTAAELQSKLETITKQYEFAIERAELLTNNLYGIRESTEKCLSITGQLGDGITTSIGTVKQLRNRIDIYENTIRELNSELFRIKESISIE